VPEEVQAVLPVVAGPRLTPGASAQRERENNPFDHLEKKPLR
jgi:hypothetical protein